MLEGFLLDAVLAAYGEVDTAIGVLLRGNDVGWDVARERGAGLNHRTLADACLGVFDDRTGEDDVVLNLAVACNLRAIAEDAVVANLGVVADVGTLHEHVLVADDGLAAGVRSTVDDDILTDDVAVADDTLRLLAAELEVLRQGTDDGSLMDFVALAHACTATDADEGEDDAAIAYLDVILDVHEGEYLTVVADFRFGANLGLGGYFACHNYSLFTIHFSLLFRSAAEGLIEVHHGLHLVELVGDLVDLGVEKVRLSRDDL